MPTINLRDYGAGQGCDDTAAMQAATLAAVGGVLLIPAGDYHVTAPAQLDSVTVRGEGAASRIQTTQAGGIGAVFKVTGKGDVTIEDVALCGTNDMNAAHSGISLEDAWNVTVRRCEGYHFKNMLLRVLPGTGQSVGVTVVDNYVHDIKTPAMASAIPACGLDPSNVRGGDYSRNRIERVGQDTGDWGIYSSRIATDLTITGNHIRDCGGGGIKVSPSTGVSERVIIGGNVIAGCQYEGIVVVSARRVSVTGNVITPATNVLGNREGVKFSPQVTDSSISGNSIEANGNDGYQSIVLVGAERVRVDGNVLADYQSAANTIGIYLPTSAVCRDIAMTDNQLYLHNYGVLASGLSAAVPHTGIVAADNRAKGCRSYGVYLQRVSGGAIRGNDFAGQNGAGAEDCTLLDVCGNTSSGAGPAFTYSHLSHCRVAGNCLQMGGLVVRDLGGCVSMACADNCNL